MASAARGLGVGTAPAVPLRSAPAGAMSIDAEVVIDVLALVAGADTAAAVAGAGLPVLLDLPGVRAAAVVTRDRARVVVLGSAGYDCGPMSPGGALPLDAGLPVTEAVRTGKPVVQGQGPSWVAVPFSRARGGRGALLLSLEVPPPQELSRLARIARAVGDGLDRAAAHEAALAALVTAGLPVAVEPAPGWDVAVRSLPHDAPSGGDVVLCLPDGRGGTWLIAADVCGSGLPAAAVGRTVQATLTALAAVVSDPGELLAAADRGLRRVVGPEGFVTATALHVRDGCLAAASAGHPPPLLVTASDVVAMFVEPGQPLALETGEVPDRPALVGMLPPGATLLLHSDGLCDRRAAGRAVAAEPAELVRGLPTGDLQALADGVLAAAELVGAAGDDVSLLVARPTS